MLSIKRKSYDWQAYKTTTACNEHMLVNQLACDVTFLCGESERKISAHKYILISRSCVFNEMLSTEGTVLANPVLLPDVTIDTFRVVLKFLYCEVAELNDDNAFPVLHTAKKFLIASLIDECRDFMRNNVTTENVSRIIEQSHVYNEKEIENICMLHIFEHGDDVLKSGGFNDLCLTCVDNIISSNDLRVKNEESVFEAVTRWVEEDCARNKLPLTRENKYKLLGDVKYKLRVPLLSLEYFREIVVNSDLLTDAEKVEIFKYHTASSFPANAKTMLPFPALQRNKSILICSRFSSFVAKDFTANGVSTREVCAAIEFQCNTNIELRGVQVYGLVPGSADFCPVSIHVFDVDDVIIGAAYASISSRKSLFKVFFTKPISIRKRDTMNIRFGYESRHDIFRGSGGTSMVEVGGATFNFFNSTKSHDGTNVSHGQIPGILFDVL